MEYPVHAALLACHLYGVLVEWFQGEEVFYIFLYIYFLIIVCRDTKSAETGLKKKV